MRLINTTAMSHSRVPSLHTWYPEITFPPVCQICRKSHSTMRHLKCRCLHASDIAVCPLSSLFRNSPAMSVAPIACLESSAHCSLPPTPARTARPESVSSLPVRMILLAIIICLHPARQPVSDIAHVAGCCSSTIAQIPVFRNLARVVPSSSRVRVAVSVQVLHQTPSGGGIGSLRSVLHHLVD